MIRPIVVVLLISCASAGCTNSYRFRIVRVINGDHAVGIIDGNEFRIRLLGVDAPKRDHPLSAESKQLLSSLILNKYVTAELHGKDRYGNRIADLFAGDVHVNLAMVRSGMARCQGRVGPHIKKRVEAQRIATAERRGLWFDKSPEQPWAASQKKKKKRR